MINGKPMNLWKISLLIVAFLIVLSGLRTGWVMYFSVPEHEHAVEGEIDLSNYDFTSDKAVTLDGEWEFYPDEFRLFDDVENMEKKYETVPLNWRDLPGSTGFFDTHGYGTYRLMIQLPETEGALYGIRANIASAADVYIDGTLVTSFGTPGATEKESEGKLGPFSAYFEAEEGEIELVIHASNFGHPIDGGIHQSIFIGSEQAISERNNVSKTSQIVVAVIYVLHGLYAFTLFFLGRGDYHKDILLFGLMLVIHSIGISLDDEAVLQLPFDVVWSYKIMALFLLGTLIALLAFVRYFFDIKSRIFPWLLRIFVLMVIATIVTPNEYLGYVIVGYGILYLFSLIYFFVRTIQIILKGLQNGIFLSLFLASYFSNMTWGLFINAGRVEAPFYPIDFLVTIFWIVLLLFQRQIHLFEENKQYTIELQQVDKRKDEFLTTTSHELRNPIHAILNITHTVLEDASSVLSERNKKNLKLIIHVGEQMRYNLEDLLDVSRLQDGVIRLQQKPIHLHQVASGVLDMVRFTTGKKNIEFILKIRESFPLIHADKNRLIQIMFNLLHNSAKFTDEGSITVDATHKGGMATVSITDTGIGIEKQVLQSIFKPYTQGKAQHNGEGFGLGLYICKQLVELHGGNIFVESKVGEGATFSFTIPLADKNQEEKVEQEVDMSEQYVAAAATLPDLLKIPTYSGTKKVKILIVDDDPVNLNVLANMLAHEYKVYTAVDGEEALEKLTVGEWDLVITDVMMPKMSGYELTQKIREKFSVAELPVLLLTARSQEVDIYTGFHAGANDYVTKPVDAIELKARVKALTGLKEAVKDQLKMEAAWLQAQIQPHFLFNTLNTIASLGVTDTKRMIKLLEEFGNYLYKSFQMHNMDSLICIQDELELTQSYAYIEKERFGGRVEVVCGIKDELKFKIPPLTIQPIVENAINHGILKQVDGGIVWVRVRERDEDYRIEIEDNGVGLSEEQIKQLLQTKTRPTTNGIGLFNTNRRLIKLYGKGLDIQSKEGEGTVVSFNIPKE